MTAQLKRISDARDLTITAQNLTIRCVK